MAADGLRHRDFPAGCVFMVSAYGIHSEDITEFVETVIATIACLLFCRIMGNVYHMVIRYGGVGVYMRLLQQI